MSTAAVIPETAREVRTILLVDDQSFVGMALTRLLSAEADLKVHCCLDAEAAIAQANAIKPELILQDLVMPKLDGLALLKMYRENPATARTPVVVLSGNDDAETRARALAAGASDYLVKLPPPATLVACLRRHLNGQSEAKPVSAPPVAASHGSLDRSVMADLQSGGPGDASGLVPGLIDQFIKEITAQLDALRDALRKDDAPALKAAAHRLKGGAAMMGANTLSALCRQLETDLGQPGRDIAVFALVTAITEEVKRVRDACAQERERFAAQS